MIEKIRMQKKIKNRNTVALEVMRFIKQSLSEDYNHPLSPNTKSSKALNDKKKSVEKKLGQTVKKPENSNKIDINENSVNSIFDLNSSPTKQSNRAQDFTDQIDINKQNDDE